MSAPIAVSSFAADSVTSMADFAGGSNQVYSGLARSVQPEFTFTAATVSAANPAVVGFTGHGLQADNGVTISGATGDWAVLNGTHAVTVVNANSFSVAVDASAAADPADFDGVVMTTAPRTNAACWAIVKSYWDATGKLRDANADGNTSSDNVWSNRASLIYQ